MSTVPVDSAWWTQCPAPATVRSDLYALGLILYETCTGKPAWLVAGIMPAAPWTLDMSRWYWWRGWFVVAVVAGLAFWGFRNALGRQSAFPSGALDA